MARNGPHLLGRQLGHGQDPGCLLSSAWRGQRWGKLGITVGLAEPSQVAQGRRIVRLDHRGAFRDH